MMLVIYSKKDTIEHNKYADILEDFSLHGKRKIKIKSFPKAIIAVETYAYEYENMAIDDADNIGVVIGGDGYYYGSQDTFARFILKTYEASGNFSPKRISGAFSFAIYDNKTHKLIIGNDCFGFYPVFVHEADEYFIFCTEYQPIIKHKRFVKELEYDAVAEYYLLGHIIGNKTFFKGISNLAPGTIMTLQNNSIPMLIQYDSIDVKVDYSKDMNYFADKIEQCLRSIATSRFKDGHNISCDLSGGGDTRLMLANMTKQQRDVIEFRCCDLAIVPSDFNKEIVIAKMIAKELDLKLHIIDKTASIEFDTSHFERNRVIHNARTKHFSMIYGGELLSGILRNYGVEIVAIGEHEFDRRLRKIFSESFLGRVSNPYQTIQRELERIKSDNKEFLFAINTITRGFFTYIYGGTRGGSWSSPHYFPIDANVFLFDGEFVKILLSMPIEFLKDYKFYNYLYKNKYHGFTIYPSLSNITNLSNACMSYPKEGIDPRDFKYKNKPLRYRKALLMCIFGNSTWNKRFYNTKYVMPRFLIKNHHFINRLIDFNTWYQAMFFFLLCFHINANNYYF